MEAGLFYTSPGPWILAVVFLLYVFVIFRQPLWGAWAFVGIVLAAPLVSYRPDVQAVLIGASVLVVLAAVVSGRARHPAPVRSPLDVGMGVVAGLVVLAALHGYLAGNSRLYWAGDLYHFLLTGPLLYFGFRALVRAEDVTKFLTGYLTLATVAAAIALAILWRTDENGSLVWLIGAPLDEGGVRLKPDFGFPLVPLIVVTAGLLARPRIRWGAGMVLLAATLILTYKRTFWLAYLAGALSLLLAAPHFLTPPGRAAMGTLARRTLLIVLLIAAGGGLARLLGLNPSSAATRGLDLHQPASVGTFQTRTAEWSEAIRYIRAHPLGLGLGAAPRLPYGDPSGRPTHYVHNNLLHWSIQAGLPTALLGASLLVVFWVMAWRRRHDVDVLTTAASVGGLAVAGVAVLSFYSPMGAVMLAIGVTRAMGVGRDPGERPGGRI